MELRDRTIKKSGLSLRRKYGTSGYQEPVPIRSQSRGRAAVLNAEKSIKEASKPFELSGHLPGSRTRPLSSYRVNGERVKSASNSRYNSPIQQKPGSRSPAPVKHKRSDSDGRNTHKQGLAVGPSYHKIHSANVTPKRQVSFLQLQIDPSIRLEDLKRRTGSHNRDLSLEVRPGNGRGRTNVNSSADTVVHITHRGSSLDPNRPTNLSGLVLSNVSKTNLSFESDNSDDGTQQEKERLMKYLRKYYIQKHTMPTTTSDYYQFVRLVGKGAFGKVSLAIHKLTNMNVAIKSIDKSYMKDDRTRRKVFQEVVNMRKICNFHVVRLFEVFESSRHFNMVLEYCGGGDLLHFIKMRGKLPESEAKMIFYHVTEAVKACHTQGIIHRDVKLDNVLLDFRLSTAKLCDFGVSRMAVRGQHINDQCGTPAYIAPEIVVDRGYDGFYVDLWSMGVLLYAMVVGTVPFRASTLPELHKLILRGKYQIPGSLSKELQHLINGLLQLVPQSRISLDEILKHPWFSTESDETEVSESMTARFVGGICSHDSGRPADAADQATLGKLELLGLPGEFAWHCLRISEINHATATYELLLLNNPETL